MNCCLKPITANLSSKSTIKAHLSIKQKPKAKLQGVATIKANDVILESFAQKINASATIKTKLSSKLALKAKITGNGQLTRHLSLNSNLKQKISATAVIEGEVAKFAGIFRPNDSYDKLYPIEDLDKLNLIGVNGNSQVSSNLFDLINEGVYTGDYHLNNRPSESLFSWDDYIKSSGNSEFTSYSAKMSLPAASFKESYVVFNVQAFNSKHKIYDIKFLDEEDNLICEYEDIEFTGDNYPVMYSSKPRINNGAEYTWSAEYPKIPSSGCTLSFKTQASIIENADAFDKGFSSGFERSSILRNPEIRISAIEICNSGDFGFRHEGFLPAFVGVRLKGDRLERMINPSKVLPYNFDTDVWPEVQTVWENTYGYSNLEESHGRVLALDLSKPYDYSNITLQNSSIADSGKLNLLFEHKPQNFVFGFRDGAFGISFNDSEFDVAHPFKQKGQDDFFVVDEISLKVRAKKAIGSRDYTFDVVGWSDDNLLNVTSQVRGFLQNTSGVGVSPTVSGWNNLDQEGISSTSISEQEEYYEQNQFSTDGADHYKLYPSMVNSTVYRDYEIPLVIEIDRFKLGLQDFSSSSFFEKLFLDIYPLPSGASISSLQLSVKYTPSNALMFNVLGGDLARIALDRSEGKFFPTTRQTNDDFVNIESGSFIENIPHGYKTPQTLKTNYARRWRGVEGLVSGPFNPNEFDFSFENPQLDSPFIDGHYDFNDVSGNVLYSRPLANIPPNSGVGNNPIEVVKNIGFRFQSPTLISGVNSYQSIDGDNNVVDAYDNVFDSTSYIRFKNLSLGSGFATYVRFSQEDNISGVVPFITTADQSFHIVYNYSNSTLFVYAAGNNRIIRTGRGMFPLSVITDYKDGVLKVYSKYESDRDVHKSIFNLTLTDPGTELHLRSSTRSFVHELGFSTAQNILDEDTDTPNLLFKQQTAQSFIRAHSVNWSQSGDDTYTLPSYIDEDTSDWHLGGFKSTEFSAKEFDTFTKRVGRDAINYRLVCDGRPYFTKTDLAFPSTIDSGVSYHTQIENDFLRFSLSDTSPNFYSPSVRISKNLPRGYTFEERAFVVETIVDYKQIGDIVWPDGKLGPKLIVSLYTKNQELVDYPTENYGLINRKVHYLKPNTAWAMLESTFDPESFFDETEKWSIFPEERRLTEFNHKYFSKDIDDMFLQYDLVAPSGNRFEVNMNIHSANVRLENALVKPTLSNNSFNVFTSGEQYSYSNLPMHTDAIGVDFEYLNFHLSGVPTPVDTSTVYLCTSGAYFQTGALDLFTQNKRFVDLSGDYLDTSGNNPIYGLFMSTSGNYRVEGEMNFVVCNTDTTFPADTYLPLHTFGTDGNPDLSRSLNMVAYSSLTGSQGAPYGAMNLDLLAYYAPQDHLRNNSMNLFVETPKAFAESINLVLFGRDNDALKIDSFFNLYSKCYPSVYLNGSGTEFLSWNNRNIGRSTEEEDETLLTVSSIDLIRGVQTVCYGDCTNVEGKCFEQAIVTHDTDWSNNQCVDGGILRGSTTYTNSGVYAFGDVNSGPYAGHFYGSRKYQGLFPNTPYEITVIGKAGDRANIDLPREWEEWEYGTLGDIDFKGFKFTAETDRHVGDLFGKAVNVRGDLLGIGAPGHDLGVYKEAGAIFLYRREEATGGEKANWTLEEKLTLPSGFIGDWFYDRGGSISFPGIGTIPEKQWNIGQEGRELGHSFDIAITEDREVIIAGGPGAKWDTRGFEEIETSGVNVAIMIFTNEFEYDSTQIDKIKRNLETQNFLYKYFADPAVHINLKIISCIPTGIFDTELSVQPGIPDLIVKTIPRAIPTRPENSVTTAEMLSGIKSAFFEAFPYDNTKINNNIPPIVGFYVDNSRSLGRPVVEPAVDQFVSFYNNYSFQSGVRDFYNHKASGYIYEYVPTAQDKGEDWFTISNNLVNDLLDTGHLYQGGHHTLITSGIGLEFANVDAVDFNLPPDSGGRVYVFEKEDSGWSLIQEIRSPSSSYATLPARFGHSVSISQDASTFAIGSPFIRESCSIYEFNPVERGRLYNNIGRWLNFRDEAWVTIGQYTSKLDKYNELATISGSYEAGKQIYSELNTTDKFKARSDYDFWNTNHIQEYGKVFKYGLDDIKAGFKGTFTKLLESAPNPRLGYSSAVSEDGDVVAFGSPTDSFGKYDNAGFYFLHSDGSYLSESGEPAFPRNLWASNVNTGAVRIFEKGNSFEPISERKVLEYNKFGNLSNSLNNTEGYDEEGNPTNTTAISQNDHYGKTEFADIAIPSDVGSIFIITPEIDAANDEIIAEIKRWMSLGDRRLVLVGDDPVWEKNGAYAKSNEIINKILEKLDSRMRLHPARSKREALVEYVSSSDEQVTPNIIASYTPVGSNSTNVQNNVNLFGYGVADIRLHVPDAVFTADHWGKGEIVRMNKKYGICSEYNTLCGPPIAHNGDLRARWIEREIRYPIDEDALDPYTYWERNLPFEFYSNGLPPVKAKDAVYIAKDLSLVAQGEQPRPLMVAAEFTENYGIVPAIPEVKLRIPTIETICYESNSSNTYYTFADSHVDEVAFLWTASSGNGTVNRNIGNNFSEGRFYDPTEFNDRDALLQADGTLDIQVTTKELTEYFKVGNLLNYVAKKSVGTSAVYLIAGTETETQAALSNHNDENISFYDNLVRNQNCDNAFIIQLGGWTERSSFAAAGQGSLLRKVFTVLGHDLVENWTGSTIPASKDVVWIANAMGEPTQADLNAILTWLLLGNKKLVITYEKQETQSSKAYRLCDSLNLGMKPCYLPGANKFPTTDDYFHIKKNITDGVQISEDSSIKGCNTQSEVTEFTLNNSYCPIDIRSGGSSVVWYKGDVDDEKLQVTTEYNDVWTMNTGVAKVKFPATPGSGYRIFYNWIADRPEEKQNIDLYVGDVHYKRTPDTRAMNPQTFEVAGNLPITDYDADRDLKIVDYATNGPFRLEAPSFGTAISKGYVDVQVPHNKDYINLFLTGNRASVNTTNNQVPRTYKFLSVSGAPLAINSVTEVFTYEYCKNIETGFTEIVTQEYVAPRTILLPATIKPIMNDNTRYCIDGNSCGGKLVADGPVVIAEEPEHFSNGSTGNSRSKILLISDSTIVNGSVEVQTGDTNPVSGVPTISKNIMLARVNSFLNSLTTTETTLVGNKTQLNNGYKFSEKIVSPEKGSAAIYSLVQSGMDHRFGGYHGGAFSQFGDENNYSEGKIVQNIHQKLDKFEEAEKAVMAEFSSSVGTFGSPLMSYSISGIVYSDPAMSGDPFSSLFKATGKDFLDYDFQSGSYPGDLFGHSLDIHNGKLVVGSPYSAYTSDSVVNFSGIADISHLGNVTETGNEGGGGSVYVFDKTIELGWKVNKKLKPDDVRSFGNSDRFGWSISMDGDFLVASAPGHDFENLVDYQKGAFVRKEFNASFDIGTRTVTSIGSGQSPASNDTGAIFTFQNKLYDWANRAKDWIFVEKVLPQGYMSNEKTKSYGNNVSISRFARTDSDYAMAVGSHKHSFGLDNTYVQTSGAGATYTYDAILRNQPPATFSEESWLKASVFGQDRLLDEVKIEINQYSDEVIARGTVYSDNKGQIFLEASGQDPRELGYIVQRPYIERVEGEVARGETLPNYLELHSMTDPFDMDDSVNLFMLGQESDIVYNTLGLSTGSAYMHDNSGISLLVKGDVPHYLDNSGLMLHTTASGISDISLDLRVRGK